MPHSLCRLFNSSTNFKPSTTSLIINNRLMKFFLKSATEGANSECGRVLSTVTQDTHRLHILAWNADCIHTARHCSSSTGHCASARRCTAVRSLPLPNATCATWWSVVQLLQLWVHHRRRLIQHLAVLLATNTFFCCLSCGHDYRSH